MSRSYRALCCFIQLKNAYIQDLEKLSPELEALLSDKAGLEEQVAQLQQANSGLQQQAEQSLGLSEQHAAHAQHVQQLQAEIEELRTENAGLYDGAATSRQVWLD